MKRLNVLSSCLLFCALVVGISTRAEAATVTLTSSGISPSVLQVKTGDAIGFAGLPNGQFYGGTVTSAPAGSKVSVGGNPQWLAGCLEFGFTPDVAGTYTFAVIYYNSTYSGTVTVAAAATDTVRVTYSDPGPDPNPIVIDSKLDVKVGDVVIFDVGYMDRCADEVYLVLISVPNGAPNPAPTGTCCAMDLNTGHGPLTYPITQEGTYTFNIHGTSGGPQYTGTITASAPAAASVQDNGQRSGFSMMVAPEPSNGTATIRFSADKPADVHLALFDATGKQVHQYDDVKLAAGAYSMPLSSSGLPSGDYFLRASAGGATLATTKVLIVR